MTAGRCVAWVLAGLVIAGVTRADAAEVTLKADLLSAYLWRGITFNDGVALQPAARPACGSIRRSRFVRPPNTALASTRWQARRSTAD